MGVKYMECLKNHAAAIGGNARDGCCEFMPSGEEGSFEAFKCSACNCHRNFHKKRILMDSDSANDFFNVELSAYNQPYKCGSGVPQNSNSDTALMVMKKRFRTKFTEEQKEKMLRFAERAGWRMKKVEEGVVQEFCEEIGIKRRVLKVWMHNNKHTFFNNKLRLPPPN